ncbi:histone deacetylase [Perkinsela sp. CCAP 1560/4]|nr:histone deacetylase [Perkinsela sp. CCAP 1560/4]|eukprot:KNH07382.1 histone deacetylase [Perkinsela sp. CCAP 1560/4]
MFEVFIPFDDTQYSMSENPFAFLDPATPTAAKNTALVYDRHCELHESNEAHPECPDRVKLPLKHLRYCGLLNQFTWLGEVEPCSRERLTYAHDKSYVDEMIEKLKNYKEHVEEPHVNGVQPEMSEDAVDALLDDCLDSPSIPSAGSNLEVSVSTPIETHDTHDESEHRLAASPESTQCSPDIYFNAHTHDACLHAAGGAVQAAVAVARGEVDNAMCLLRPPGHHAGPSNASGFCIFNNVAVAARTLQRETPNVKRVVILDWDVHHGDGTEKIFYEDPSVLCISIHQYARGHPHRFYRRSAQYRMSETYRMLTKEGCPEGAETGEQRPAGTIRDVPVEISDNIPLQVGAEQNQLRPSVGDDTTFQSAKRSRRDRGTVDYVQLEAKLRKEATNQSVLTESEAHGRLAAFISNPSTKVLGCSSSGDEEEEEDDESYNPEDYDELSATSMSDMDDFYDSSAPDFYPGTGHIEDIGSGPGRGYNVNIPLTCHGFGDLEYCAIMQTLVLPLIRDFAPDFIIIAGGFDAVRHDTLGSMQLTPSGYSMMTRMLMDVLPHHRVLCVMEGGYNIPQVALCVEAVARTLLGSAGTDHSRLLLHRTTRLVQDVREKVSTSSRRYPDESEQPARSPGGLQIRRVSN